MSAHKHTAGIGHWAGACLVPSALLWAQDPGRVPGTMGVLGGRASPSRGCWGGVPLLLRRVLGGVPLLLGGAGGACLSSGGCWGGVPLLLRGVLGACLSFSGGCWGVSVSVLMKIRRVCSSDGSGTETFQRETGRSGPSPLTWRPMEGLLDGLLDGPVGMAARQACASRPRGLPGGPTHAAQRVPRGRPVTAPCGSPGVAWPGRTGLAGTRCCWRCCAVRSPEA